MFHLDNKHCEKCRPGPRGDKGIDEIVDENKFRKFVADQIADVWQRYTDIDLDELKFCQIYGTCDFKKSNKAKSADPVKSLSG